MGSRTPTAAVAVLVLAVSPMGACGRRAEDTGVPSSSAVSDAPKPGNDARRLRDDALRSARVWHPPAVPIPQVNFTATEQDSKGFAPDDVVACTFVVKPVGGTTRKFHCARGDDVLKVKYGAANHEVQAELAATRLLSALGFGTDRMYLVRRVRCAACPPFPFSALRCAKRTGLDRLCYAGGLDTDDAVSFDFPVIERRMEGRRIEGTPDQGWTWFELDRIDPAAGGSSRAEVDALRLVAVLLAHWDNKAENQRLLCLPGGDRPDGGCTASLAIIQDLGATFGPSKVDLRNWSGTPVWADRATCTVSMKDLPFEGATFPDRQISEEGRALLAGLLAQVSGRQLLDLFTAARFGALASVSAEGRDPHAWVAAFQQKVRDITGARCPSADASR